MLSLRLANCEHILSGLNSSLSGIKESIKISYVIITFWGRAHYAFTYGYRKCSINPRYIHAAISLITEHNKGGILDLTPEVSSILEAKHPKAQPANPEVLLQGEIPAVNSILFECLTCHHTQDRISNPRCSWVLYA